MQIIAITPDPEILVIQDSPDSAPRLELKRKIDDSVIDAAQIPAQGRWGSRSYQPRRWAVEQTENPAWDYTRPDCFAITENGEVEMQTQKQIKTFCRTGVVEETAKQRKTREREAFWASFKNEQESEAA